MDFDQKRSRASENFPSLSTGRLSLSSRAETSVQDKPDNCIEERQRQVSYKYKFAPYPPLEERIRHRPYCGFSARNGGDGRWPGCACEQDALAEVLTPPTYKHVSAELIANATKSCSKMEALQQQAYRLEERYLSLAAQQFGNDSAQDARGVSSFSPGTAANYPPNPAVSSFSPRTAANCPPNARVSSFSPGTAANYPPIPAVSSFSPGTAANYPPIPAVSSFSPRTAANSPPIARVSSFSPGTAANCPPNSALSSFSSDAAPNNYPTPAVSSFSGTAVYFPPNAKVSSFSSDPAAYSPPIPRASSFASETAANRTPTPAVTDAKAEKRRKRRERKEREAKKMEEAKKKEDDKLENDRRMAEMSRNRSIFNGNRETLPSIGRKTADVNFYMGTLPKIQECEYTGTSPPENNAIDVIRKHDAQIRTASFLKEIGRDFFGSGSADIKDPFVNGAIDIIDKHEEDVGRSYSVFSGKYATGSYSAQTTCKPASARSRCSSGVSRRVAA